VTVPPAEVRPTSERARQAFFNIIAPRIAGARFLDLFSGSGIFSFEAVSRGAASATAVESNRSNAAGIANLAKAWSTPITVVTDDVFAAIPRFREAFEIVYADPPYDFDRYDELLEKISDELRLKNGALVAVEHRKRTEPFTRPTRHLVRERQAEYGEVRITFFAKHA